MREYNFVRSNQISLTSTSSLVTQINMRFVKSSGQNDSGVQYRLQQIRTLVIREREQKKKKMLLC